MSDPTHGKAPEFRTLITEEGEDMFPFSRIMSDRMMDVVRDIISRMPVSGFPELPEIFLEFRTDHPGCVVPPFLQSKAVTVILNAAYEDLSVTSDGMSVRLLFPGLGSQGGDVIEVPWKAVSAISCPDHEFRLELVPRYD